MSGQISTAQWKSVKFSGFLSHHENQPSCELNVWVDLAVHVSWSAFALLRTGLRFLVLVFGRTYVVIWEKRVIWVIHVCLVCGLIWRGNNDLLELFHVYRYRIWSVFGTRKKMLCWVISCLYLVCVWVLEETCLVSWVISCLFLYLYLVCVLMWEKNGELSYFMSTSGLCFVTGKKKVSWDFFVSNVLLRIFVIPKDLPIELVVACCLQVMSGLCGM